MIPDHYVGLPALNQSRPVTMSILKIIFVTLAAAIMLTTVQAQSFSCSAARKPDEIAICRSKELSSLDFQTATQFAIQKLYVAKEYRQRLVDGQKTWLEARGFCGSDYGCIKNLYRDRLRYLQTQVFPRRPPGELEIALPHGIGQCVETTIVVISDRFNHDLHIPSKDRIGTRVFYSNGGGQVSYEVEHPIVRSRVGDRVRMCLESVPKNCPPGDQRGKTYRTQNLRSGEAWLLSDSEHMCGGA